jgi:predicted transcriptional regulator
LNFYKRKKDYSINSRDCYTRKCDVRLTDEQDTKLSELASQNGVSRGEIVRKAIEDFWKFNTNEEE